MAVTPAQSFGRNLLLRALQPADRALIAPHMEQAELARGVVLFDSGEPVSHVTFPCDRTVTTLVITMRDGRTAETATVGREGAVGGVVSQGYLPAYSRAVVQIGGPVLRLEAGRLQTAKHASRPLRNLFTRYSDCLLAQVLQSVACNALHPIEQRAAKWLLTLHDRLSSDVLPITQDVLAEMLGVRRTYLSGVLRGLHERRMIEVARGRVTILDRSALERAACECHGRVRRHFEDVLGAVHLDDGTLIAVDPTAAAPPSGASARGKAA
ncbi:Crp/Fnr family transcriptional regulator [uncultured Methylobacterium sp.]|uniref:Crp/Fnr family transcriptional regulator n=1 Tax=uncultured Methylobacterium sp. TaxID=157278 RepID=UPI0035C99CDD